jgi:hypothetical protein
MVNKVLLLGLVAFGVALVVFVVLKQGWEVGLRQASVGETPRPPEDDPTSRAETAIRGVLDGLRTKGLLALSPLLPDVEARARLDEVHARLEVVERQIQDREDVTVRVDWRLDPESVRAEGGREFSGVLRICPGEGRFTFRRGDGTTVWVVMHGTSAPLDPKTAYQLVPPPRSFDGLTEELADPHLLRRLRAIPSPSVGGRPGEQPLFIHVGGLAGHPREISRVRIEESGSPDQKVLAITALGAAMPVRVEMTADGLEVRTVLSLSGSPPSVFFGQMAREGQ